jgi:hypothetical protein
VCFRIGLEAVYVYSLYLVYLTMNTGLIVRGYLTPLGGRRFTFGHHSAQQLALLLQALVKAKQIRLRQLQAVEDGISKLGRAQQELDAWLRVNESKVASLRDGSLTPEDVIVASDALSAQAIQAQVRASCIVHAAAGLLFDVPPPSTCHLMCKNDC